MHIIKFLKLPKSRVSIRLFRVVFGLYFFVALITTVVQLYSVYVNEEKSVKDEVDQLFHVLSPALTSALWDFNTTGIDTVVEGLFSTHSVSGLSIQGDYEVKKGFVLNPLSRKMELYQGDKSIIAKEHQPLKLYAYNYPLTYKIEGQGKKDLGRMTIYSDSDIVFQRSEHIFIATIINAIIKTLFLWLIFYFSIHYIISRPLIETTESINHFNPSINKTLLSHRKSCIQTLISRKDELGVLVRAFLDLKVALQNEKKKLLKHQSSLEDIVRQRTKELEQLATHDHLTGLYNRKAFDDQLCQCQVNSSSSNKFVLCFIDLDKFKGINDQFGHLAGDFVLVKVSEIMQVYTRNDDFVARVGGDEFGIIFKSSNYDEVINRSESIRKIIEDSTFNWQGKSLSLAVSIGLSRVIRKGLNVEHILHEADSACYTAKSSGRNKVCTYTEH